MPAALDFPASPTVGQTYPNPPVTGQPTYQWDGAQWLSKFALGKEYVPLDGTAPMTGLLTLSGTPVNPLHAATKTYVDAADTLAVRYDTAQSLTVNQRAQARANVDVTKKNYIINGAMMVSQENAGTAGTANAYYPVDCFAIVYANAGTQTAQAVFVPTPGGSTYRLRVTATAADASVGAGDYCTIRQAIEGVRLVELRMGTASAKTITIQFGVKAPAGTYCVALRNAAVNRTYIAEYVITAGEANTDVVKQVVVLLDTAGTWASDNTVGIDVSWTLMGGSALQTTAGSWTAANMLASPNQFNFMGTGGNVFELFDVSLTEGNVAPPFQVPDYASELDLCRRYWRKLGGQVVNDMYIAGYGTAAGVVAITLPLAPPMRAAPTLAIASAFTNVNVATISHALSPDSVAWLITPSAVGQMTYAGGSYNLNARL